MKVWECNECDRGEPCRMISDDVKNLDGVCLDADWHETTRYEIPERKPDYTVMAAKEQLGKDENGQLCILLEYHDKWEEPFIVWRLPDTGKSNSATFTPCAEPVELDPITMKPKD